MPRQINFGFNTPVHVGSYVLHTRSGSCNFSTDLADVSSTSTGIGRQREFGLHEAELTLSLQMDINSSPHAAPVNLGPRRTIVGPIKIYKDGLDKDPYVFRNLKSDRLGMAWDVPNPNTLEIHGFTSDYDDPVNPGQPVPGPP